MTFAQLSAWLKNFLGGWLLVLGIKKGLVECATVCVKSVVILKYVSVCMIHIFSPLWIDESSCPSIQVFLWLVNLGGTLVWLIPKDLDILFTQKSRPSYSIIIECQSHFISVTQEAINPTTYNIIRWCAGLMVQMTLRPIFSSYFFNNKILCQNCFHLFLFFFILKK